MKTVLLLLVILSFVENSLGYCYAHSIQGTQCTAKNGVTIPVGGELLIPEKCEKCTCSTHDADHVAISCCGYGIHAGVIQAPSGCKVVADEDGCSVKYVKITDESLPCL